MEKKQTEEPRSPTWKNCARIMAEINKKKGPGRIGDKTVNDAIGLICGGDPRTVKRYRAALFQFGFLKVR